MTSSIKSPCLNCINRSINCHSTCESYKSFRQNLDAFNKMVRDEKHKENDYNDHLIESKEHMKRKMRRRK